MTAIESRLRIAKSTLSYWFRGIQLTPHQQSELVQRKLRALERARVKAVAWHRRGKARRLREAEQSARAALRTINLRDPATLEVALAMLYLGEGAKSNTETAMGNADPVILRFFLRALRTLYAIDINNVRCELTLRADQDTDRMVRYWTRALQLSKRCFKYVGVDRRTIGVPTYPGYHGVCYIRCGNVAIQRKLLAIARQFCGGAIG